MKKVKIELKKLVLNKEKITSLSSHEINQVYGGEQISRGGVCEPGPHTGTPLPQTQAPKPTPQPQNTFVGWGCITIFGPM